MSFRLIKQDVAISNDASHFQKAHHLPGKGFQVIRLIIGQPRGPGDMVDDADRAERQPLRSDQRRSGIKA